MQPGLTPEGPPNPSLVFEMMQAHYRTAALKGAIDLDLFRAVGEGPGDVASIARHCSASERGIRILCDFLTLNGVLVKENGRYQHTPTSATFLDPSSPACLASVAQFLSNPALREPTEHLAEIVRSGRTSLPGQGSVEPDNPIWVQFAETMAPMMAGPSDPFASLVLEGHTGPVRVLDIAAGHGLFGIAIAKQNLQAQIVALDWPAVLQVAAANAAKADVTDRYHLRPGSAFDVDFGEPYDIVLLTNFLHHFDKPTNVQLLKKIRAALKPGGCIAALEFVPNEDRVSPPMPAAFSMTMLLSTAAGDAYTFAEYTDMYTQAGLSRITEHPVPMSPETAVIGYA